jgi:putative membrane-bound dehydrogenase-like protein
MCKTLDAGLHPKSVRVLRLNIQQLVARRDSVLGSRDDSSLLSVHPRGAACADPPMKSFSAAAFAILATFAHASDGLTTRNPNPPAPAAGGAALLDPARDLPRHPPVEPADALATWRVKPGFRLELVAHEPQVRDPVAIAFDENGRMFVCEMIDYSERRDATPHLGRISLLEDRDGDGYHETSTVFADNLPLPTALIWANGGLFVAATPNIWRFEDRDGDGRAEVREVVFTGFGRGLRALNMQTLLSSFAWGPDNRIHALGGPGNRGLVSSPKRPDLPAEEIGGRDFWFDPLTYTFGFEAGGGQYGLSFDNHGRKLVSSNSDHLQLHVYDDRYAQRNPYFAPPASRQSIAADGGAAEVFRISPDEPWRIVRTRWRIGGVVRGIVEGGGRVSGYFTGATGTTVYRGDAYGPDFADNTFTGDAGGQLIHRKRLTPDGASLTGRRPDDEHGLEFAASTDSWVRVVNFANAPDGTLHVCDMYREVIEHPWSIPEEIKRHLDLNSGHDRGRIYRLVPADPDWRRRGSVKLGSAYTAELVATLSHPNGWHRDTAARLLYERQDRSAVPLLEAVLRNTPGPLAGQHALAALSGLDALPEEAVLSALSSPHPRLRERALRSAESLLAKGLVSAPLERRLAALVDDPDVRVRFQLALTLPGARTLGPALARLAQRDHADPWVSAAVLMAPAGVLNEFVLPAFVSDAARARTAVPFVASLLEISAASAAAPGALVAFVARDTPEPAWLRALDRGLRRRGTSLAAADADGRLSSLQAHAAAEAIDAQGSAPRRLAAFAILETAPPSVALPALRTVLNRPGEPVALQTAALRVLALHEGPEVGGVLLAAWPHLAPEAREAALAALLARPERTDALLIALESGQVDPRDLPAARLQALLEHRDPGTAERARRALAAVLPPSRAEVAARFAPALDLAGDAARGRAVYQERCYVCHRAAGEGLELGPDLATAKGRGRDSLLTALLEPHREVAPQYIAYSVTTHNGTTYSGIVTRDDAAGVTLKLVGGTEIAIPRSDIRGTTSAGRSLMPEGLEQGLEIQAMADLLTFIETLP